MNKKANDLPATKGGLSLVEKKLTKRLDGVDKRLDDIDKRFDATEKVLRMEIKLSAENTKEEIKTFFTESVSRIMDSVDVFMVEIKASREERIIMSHQIARCSERLDVLEEKLHVAV